MENIIEQPKVIICDCGLAEHQLVITKDDEFVNFPQVYIQPSLIHYNGFFKRLWIGIRYAFAYTSKYGQFDSIIVNKNNYGPLKEAIKFLENENI
jgi:hypothetical protein